MAVCLTRPRFGYKNLSPKTDGTCAPENGWSTSKGDSELELGNPNFLGSLLDSLDDMDGNLVPESGVLTIWLTYGWFGDFVSIQDVEKDFRYTASHPRDRPLYRLDYF